MKTKNYLLVILLIVCFTAANIQAQQIVGYSGLFTFNTVGAQLTADFTVDTTNFTGKMVTGNRTGFVYDVNQAIQFLDKSVGASLPNNWTWNFGDGSSVVKTQNPIHAFSKPGNYTVNLCVANQAGVTDDVVKIDYIVVGQPNNGIELHIVETGGTNEVKWVGYQYRNKFQILRTVDDIPVENHQASINWDSKFLWENDFNNEIILYGEESGVKKRIGHIYFEYEHAVEKGSVRNAILILNNDDQMSANFPYRLGKQEYDSKWIYYKIDEYPVSMLIPPDNTFPLAFDKLPLLFVHGWGGTYSYEKDPDALTSANEVSYWFTTIKKVNEFGNFQAWQFYYPYDTDIRTLGKCLKSALDTLKQKYPNNKIGIVSHSMGGLVTSEYITSNPSDAKEKVFKVLYSVPPIHGSLGANKHYKTNVGGLVQFFADKDRDAPAPRDMSLGSEYMWNLHNKDWENLNGEDSTSVMDDYFVLLGTTKNYFGIAGKIHDESTKHNDGVVSISSGSLTDKQIGFATFNGNHYDGVHAQSKIRNDLTNQNIGNPSLIPTIINAYFTQNYPGFLNTIKSLSDIQTVVDGNRNIEKPSIQNNWEAINTNLNIDFKKGILNFRLNSATSFNGIVPNFLVAYYNPVTKKLIATPEIHNRSGFSIVGTFAKNHFTKSSHSYFFYKYEDVTTYEECAFPYRQGENYLTIEDYFTNPIIFNHPVTLNYSETNMIDFNSVKSSELEFYHDQTDLKKDSISTFIMNPSELINTGFWINTQDTIVRFTCRITSDSLLSDVLLKLKTPDGVVVDSNYINGIYNYNPDLLEFSMTVNNPEAGKWYVWAEPETILSNSIQYQTISYLQSDLHAYVASTKESAATESDYDLMAGLQMDTLSLSDSLIVIATVFKPGGSSEIINIYEDPIQTDSSLIFHYNYPVDSAGYYLVKFNYEGVYDGYRFERALWHQFKAIDTIPILNIPNIVLRQQESQKTLQLSQYTYNVEDYDTLYFSSEIIASNLDSQEFTATLDSLALSAYLNTNLADTGTVMMRYSCHFDDQVISDTVEIKVLLPELVFEAFQIADSIACNSSDMEINYSILNTGNYHTGSYDIRYYLSQDSLIQPEDYCLGLKTILNHNADTTLSILDTINIPVLDLAGPYFLLANVDAINQINETDETNNLAIQRIYLNLPPIPPTIVSAIPDDGIVDLTWASNNQTGISGYIIYFSLDSTAVLDKVYTLSSDTSHTVSGLINDTTYYFAVSAYKMMGNESQRSSFIPATPTALKNQLIQLFQGWSGLSSYITPLSDNTELMFTNILSDLIILQSSTGMYWPGQNINTLGEWNTYEGYQIKVANAVELSISGSKTNNKTLQLSAGWNLIPVLSECTADVAALFEGQNLVIVKEVAGWNMYWPEFGINTLGVLVPGKAYFVLMGSDGTIEFPDCTNLTGFANLSGLNNKLTTLTGLQNLSGFTHTIAIPLIAAIGFREGDIIAAYDEWGNCFGAVNWQNQTTAITIFGNDPTTPGKDGFDEHDLLSFRMIRCENEFTLDVVFDPSMPQPYKEFVTNGLSAIRSMKIEETGIAASGFESLIKIIPNPAKDEFKLVLPHEDFRECTINIFSADGQIVNSSKVFRKESLINISKLSQGVYLLKIEMDDAVVVIRLVKN